MSEPQTVTPEHVRALLDSDDEAATLVLIEGRVAVASRDQLASDDFRGAFEVVSRADLVERLGADPGEQDVVDEAGALSVAAQQLGG